MLTGFCVEKKDLESSVAQFRSIGRVTLDRWGVSVDREFVKAIVTNCALVDAPVELNIGVDDGPLLEFRQLLAPLLSFLQPSLALLLL